MLASRRSPRPGRAGRPARGGQTAGSAISAVVTGSSPATGLSRLLRAYAITLLSALIGLPGLAAGVVTSTSCGAGAGDCDVRWVYGLVGGVVLALLVQLVLSLHLKLGWLFWITSSAITATVITNLDAWPVVLVTVLIAPGIAAWLSDPPQRRRGVLAHWAPRLGILVVVVAGLVGIGLIGGITAPKALSSGHALVVRR
ncbi:hypothetical protein FOE78_20385 [Microlunatus elymi]|uniref:Uncharacterized protein n=1 Tax=Microlunatus elymi TaxID=2596828 RepID=A0A516Q3D7_9ACTN|nr:hypothetical protein [Microlunatus elymi]QDP97945.1 hypothetical protein FOE78_20385 [Microlunatus elymi]